mmetsp:Transcript_8820/g.11722  ORF Transcript_8820/g.11722 Transcript_8820/m.11722 type:complete len:347 (-) Transcript_8820:207-1247(-)
MDVNHVDIKFPSEHTINGTRYRGEYQVYIVSTKTQRGVAVVSILIEQHPKDRENPHFEDAIVEFEKVYEANKKACYDKQNPAPEASGSTTDESDSTPVGGGFWDDWILWRHNGGRHLSHNSVTPEPSSSPTNVPSVSPTNAPTVSSAPTVSPSGAPSDSPTVSHNPSVSLSPTESSAPSDTPSNIPSDQPSFVPSVSAMPSAQPSLSQLPSLSFAPTISAQPTAAPFDKDPFTSKGQWDPMHPKFIMRSIHFYAYKGSLTEPPCTPFAHWYIIDTPMQLSGKQIDRLETVLFDNVDEDCNPTSVHYNRSVARPIQQHVSARVWQCTCKDFLSDADKKKTGKRICQE